MKSLLAKSWRWARRLIGRLPDDESARALSRALERSRPQGVRDSGLTVAVQCLEAPFYLGLFGALCQRLRALSGASSELVVIRSISGAIGTGMQQRLARSTLFTLLISSQWVRACRVFAQGVAYRSSSPAHPLSDLCDGFRSRAIWRRERSNPNISSLEILGVPVGDLIIDSYLRFRPAACFDPSDRFVLTLIWQAHRDVRRARAYFRSRRPQVYLTSYSTYIEHGIAARVALQEGVRVVSFGNFLQFGKELRLADWFHTPDTSGYRGTFDKLDRKDERLEEAQQQLEVRLSGGIDSATSYMRVSAYALTSEPLPDVHDAVVVFLHDFYDSPHVYDDLVFPDFWTWVCFTIETLQAAGRRFLLKPHPNQVAPGGTALAALTARYPGLPLLSSRISNRQLVEAGMICGVTVYGTVAHELAYMGVPCISCAKDPHHAFDFCRTARTREEYRNFLLTAQQLPITRDEMRRQALVFYYMHNLHSDLESRLLRERFIAFWQACHDSQLPADTLVQKFDELRSAPAFEARVAAIAADCRRASGPAESQLNNVVPN